MQSPIVVGTVLQNRYRILSTLGQGGFGRTYLAEDQGRFNERCALKEFIPTQSGMYALEKSKELFQREAAILYQIQHPQIPQFRAIFEENERLFLVQDYVEGKTYRALLNERKAQGTTFSEAEVMQLLRQLLPVLAHIHAKGIIHRDIAPDNIMLRQQDYLPVLIDFGVVKEIATRIQQPETVQQATTVGKLGYAPPEQMQTGRAYPNSDLYGLAVTAIVLMTGKEPQELYDDNALSWDWERHAKVSPAFAQVLNRMLSHRPGDRYQSVSEVAQALQMGNNPSATLPVQPVPPTGAPSATQVSRMQTLAVGRRPEPIAQSTNRRADPVIPSPNRDEESVWDNPWAVVAIAAGLAIVTGIAAWAVVSAVLNTRPTPTVTPTPTPTVSLTPTPSPTPTEPTEYDQPLTLSPGESVRVEGRLRPNDTINYVISGEEGQTLAADVDGEGVLLTVFAADREPLSDNAIRVQSWQGPLDYTGEYYIQVRPVQGLSTESNYSLNLNLDEAPEPEPPSPSPEPDQSPEPTIDEEEVRFPSGSEGTTVSGEVDNSVIKRYYVNAQEGQILDAALDADGPATFDVRYPNGQLVEDASGLLEWDAQLPASGDYIIDVISPEPTNYTLDVSVRNPE